MTCGTHAHLLLESNHNLATIQARLHHSSLATTGLYVKAIGREDPVDTFSAQFQQLLVVSVAEGRGRGASWGRSGKYREIGDWRLEIGEGWMEVVTGVTGAVAVYGALAGLSVWFNGRIDLVPVDRRPDGVTALWVAIGVGYTLLGATVLVWLGWPVVAALGIRLAGWAAAWRCWWCWCRRLWPPACRCCGGICATQPGVRTVSEAVLRRGAGCEAGEL